MFEAFALAVEVVKDKSARVMMSSKEDLSDLGFVANFTARFLIYSRFLVLIKLLTVLCRSRNFAHNSTKPDFFPRFLVISFLCRS